MSNEENRLVILTHGTWGENLVASAETIVGKMKGIQCFSFLPEQAIADYYLLVKKEISESNTRIIILVDLFGSSTANVAGMLTRDANCLAFSGMNLSMLIKAYDLRAEPNEKVLIEQLICESAKDIRSINQEIKRAEDRMNKE